MFKCACNARRFDGVKHTTNGVVSFPASEYVEFSMFSTGSLRNNSIFGYSKKLEETIRAKTRDAAGGFLERTSTSY